MGPIRSMGPMGPVRSMRPIETNETDETNESNQTSAIDDTNESNKRDTNFDWGFFSGVIFQSLTCESFGISSITIIVIAILCECARGLHGKHVYASECRITMHQSIRVSSGAEHPCVLTSGKHFCPRTLPKAPGLGFCLHMGDELPVYDDTPFPPRAFESRTRPLLGRDFRVDSNGFIRYLNGHCTGDFVRCHYCHREIISSERPVQPVLVKVFGGGGSYYLWWAAHHNCSLQAELDDTRRALGNFSDAFVDELAGKS